MPELPVTDVLRRSKRMVFAFPEEKFLALHLMVAGRLHWKAAAAPIPKSNGLLAMDFDFGTLVLTESGTKKRAALHAVQGHEALKLQFPVGVEPLEASRAEFAATSAVLTEWTETLRCEAAGGFPEKVTAFRKGMAVHGRYGEPCPVCGSPVQRIRHAGE